MKERYFHLATFSVSWGLMWLIGIHANWGPNFDPLTIVPILLFFLPLILAIYFHFDYDFDTMHRHHWIDTFGRYDEVIPDKTVECVFVPGYTIPRAYNMECSKCHTRALHVESSL